MVMLFNKFIITLNSQNPEFTKRTRQIYTLMRNRFCKILFDVKMYNPGDYKLIVSIKNNYNFRNIS